ncbi:MAG: hypothetical protein ISS55_04840 [Dehalococcoidales bacterium]|nr:hypothetical protein [Dehalococcoidales bacterium]
MNGNVGVFLIAALVILAIVFTLPLVWIEDSDDYRSTINLLVPIVIAVFVVPIPAFILSGKDIHFAFEPTQDRHVIVATVWNAGNASFNFNRVQLARATWMRVVGKRGRQPSEGMFNNDVEVHGADMPSRVLHGHMGVTLRKDMPTKFVMLAGGETCVNVMKCLLISDGKT